MNSKIFDCITFFRENFVTNLRFEILDKYVDFFVVCESQYDHRNNKKKFNFNLKNKKFKNKVIYIKLHKPFPNSKNLWKNQKIQRDYLLSGIKAKPDDFIMFSDPDEIPNPKLLENFKLKKKYGIFLQDHFMYKFNIYANQYSPWQGTRVCKFKNLYSINYLRQKILLKNLKKWWRIDKEKNIQIFNKGGWHFNNFLSPKELSIKLKTFAHSEFSSKLYSDPKIIKNKIKSFQDLFGRNHVFKKLNKKLCKLLLPNYVTKNRKLLKNFFI